GQLIQSTQYVVEEKLLKAYKINVIKVVGLEGMFGITTLGLILPILYLLLGMENSTNSEDNVFDFIK
ncbi:hypothetical protein HK099_002864, partial [Clydaea vesicula]